MNLSRRGLITGLGGILAVGMAPTIVRASSIMKIKPVPVRDFHTDDLIQRYILQAEQRIYDQLKHGERPIYWGSGVYGERIVGVQHQVTLELREIVDHSTRVKWPGFPIIDVPPSLPRNITIGYKDIIGE